MPDELTFDPFLEQLSGSWMLTGTMGATQLQQSVEAHWILGGQFLRVHLRQTDPPSAGRPPYEATYILGYDGESDAYLMHLFDTYGPTYARTVGVGTRRGNSVPFLFEYPGALFSNTFTWHEDSGQWTMQLSQQGPEGEWQEFATKTLSPA